MDPSAIDTYEGHDTHDPLSRHHDLTLGEDSAAQHHVVVLARQCRNRRGWRRIVINFTPSWFAVNMGTGIVSILLHNLPYNGDWLYWISVVIFSLNIVLFVIFTVISFLRYTLFRGLWSSMLRHPVQSLFLGELNPPLD